MHYADGKSNQSEIKIFIIKPGILKTRLKPALSSSTGWANTAEVIRMLSTICFPGAALYGFDHIKPRKIGRSTSGGKFCRLYGYADDLCRDGQSVAAGQTHLPAGAQHGRLDHFLLFA